MLRPIAFVCVAVSVLILPVTLAADKAPIEWDMKATIIEACSCPMFCQCYFNAEPGSSDAHASHGGGEMAEHYCKFNNAFKVDRGSYGSTKLDGAKFWIAGDLGGDFSKGEMNWAVIHFDPSVTKEQREGVQEIMKHVYPVKWKSFTVGEDKKIDWTPGKDMAIAKLDDGKAGEIILKRQEGNTSDPIVIKNLKYWGTPRNEGFVLMKNEVETLKEAPEGQKPYEFKGTNGFMITFDMNSKDAEKAK